MISSNSNSTTTNAISIPYGYDSYYATTFAFASTIHIIKWKDFEDTISEVPQINQYIHVRLVATKNNKIYLNTSIDNPEYKPVFLVNIVHAFRTIDSQLDKSFIYNCEKYSCVSHEFILHKDHKKDIDMAIKAYIGNEHNDDDDYTTYTQFNAFCNF